MDIELRLRGGEAHRPERTSKPGSLALQCVTCPQPEFNLPKDWEKDPNQYGYPSFLHAYFDMDMAGGFTGR